MIKKRVKELLKSNYKNKHILKNKDELIDFSDEIKMIYTNEYKINTMNNNLIKELFNNLSCYVHYSDKFKHYYVKSDKLSKSRNEVNEILIQRYIEKHDKTNKIKRMNSKKYKPYAYTFDISYKPKKRTLEDHGDAYGPFGDWIHDKQKDDEWTEIEERRAKQYEYLRAIVLPEQRSDEWFKMREGKLTASDLGCILNHNKYEPQYKILLKKLGLTPFQSNKFCYHGKKYEEIATMIYEYRLNVIVEEFGLLGDEKIEFLGASPDGICSPYKLDGKSKSKYVGRMLEIKCPFSRKIKTDGPIQDNIVPQYYWDQVQQQLQCCDLDECDFWQCDIQEYDSREEFINDTDSDEPFRSLETGFEKGVIIQLIPLNKINNIIDKDNKIRFNNNYWNLIYDEAIFIYPPKIEMTPPECDKWISETLSNLNKKYRNYCFDKIFYWKLCKSKNVLIKRDKKWFDENYPLVERIWNYVKFLRSNKEIKDLFVEYIESLSFKKNDHIMDVIDKLYNNDDECKKKLESYIKKRNKQLNKENNIKYVEEENDDYDEFEIVDTENE